MMENERKVVAMTYRKLMIFTALLPPILIGGFEYIRHEYLIPYLSMEAGNFLIFVITFVLSLLYAWWMFRTIDRLNGRLVEERARRAVYEERERLARELHDGIAQTLFFLNVKLKQGRIEEAQKAVAAIDNHVRQSIFNLRTHPEQEGSLTRRLHKWLSEWSAMSGIEVEEELDPAADHLYTPHQEVLIFSIVQEAFQNIRKHARAKHAALHLTTDSSGGWQMSVTDDGSGIGDTAVDARKYGLTMIAERAHSLGAAFEIVPRSPSGTELRLTHQKEDNRK
jgi:signal transduction histidine kinase